MAAGYSNTPLYKKLGMKEGFAVKLINAPDNYKELIGEITERKRRLRKRGSVAKQLRRNPERLVYKMSGGQVKEGRGEVGVLDLIHFFTNSASELEKVLPVIKQEIKKDGIIWVSWYKKSCGKPTEVTENMVRDTALAIGLVDVKICAVDEDWSGLKLVFRLKDR
jgi:hypothetical protein